MAKVLILSSTQSIHDTGMMSFVYVIMVMKIRASITLTMLVRVEFLFSLLFVCLFSTFATVWPKLAGLHKLCCCWKDHYVICFKFFLRID